MEYRLRLTKSISTFGGDGHRTDALVGTEDKCLNEHFLHRWKLDKYSEIERHSSIFKIRCLGLIATHQQGAAEAICPTVQFFERGFFFPEHSLRFQSAARRQMCYQSDSQPCQLQSHF